MKRKFYGHRITKRKRAAVDVLYGTGENMTQRHGKILLIAPEKPRICSDCGKPSECRPYGKNGADICYDCAMKDPETTDAQFKAVLDQVDSVCNIPGVIHHITTPNDPANG